MNILNLFSEIEKIDPEVYERLDSRRTVFKYFGGFGKKLAAAAVPLAFGSMLNKAYGQAGTRSVMDVLQFALLLENLEAEFYKAATAASVLPLFPNAAARTAFETIRNHEVAHVAFLRTAISGAGGTPTNYTAASFDFTAKGNLTNTFTNYGTLLAVAQAFEDTGVRAYKGQAPFLISNNDVLEAALRIHSVEARHAAHVRRMRRDSQNVDQQAWITLDQRGGLPAFAQPIYAGEAETTQAGVQLAGLKAGDITINAAEASEAFDEPLTAAQVTTIVQPFLV